MPSIYKFCRYCGRELPQGRELNFCPHCGNRLTALPTDTVTPTVEAPVPQVPNPNREAVAPAPAPAPVDAPAPAPVNVPVDVPVTAPAPEKEKPAAETVSEAPGAPIEAPVIEMPQPVSPVSPATDEPEPTKEFKTENPAKHVPEPKPRKERAAKAEKNKPEKRGKGGIRVLAAVLILAVLCTAAYLLTSLGETIDDLKTLHDVDTYFAAGDINSAVDGVSRLNAPEKYTERINPVYYAAALENKDKEDYDKALDYFALCPDYSDAKEQTAECHYCLGKRAMEAKEYDKALEYFSLCTDYSDAEEQIRACNYVLGVTAFVNKSYVDAVEYFTNAGDYNSSPDMLEQSRELLIYDENYGQKVDFETVFNWDDRLAERYIERTNADFTDRIRAVKEENEIIILIDWNYWDYSYRVFSEIDGEFVEYPDNSGGYHKVGEIVTAKIPVSDIIENEAQICIGVRCFQIYGNRLDFILYLDKEQLIDIAKG